MASVHDILRQYIRAERTGNWELHSNSLSKTRAKKKKKNSRVWHVLAGKKQLGPDICGQILFIHAILGCDTTSQPRKGRDLETSVACIRLLLKRFRQPVSRSWSSFTMVNQELIL